MRNLNVATTPTPRRNAPNNSKSGKLEILQCSPPSQKPNPKPVFTVGVQQPTKVPSLPPQPQRLIVPTPQQLQQHQQAHQQHLQHVQQQQQVQVQQQSPQKIQQHVSHQQQQLQPQQQLQQNQTILLLPTASQSQTASLVSPGTSNQILTVQQAVGNSLQVASSGGALQSNHVNVQPINTPVLTSFPASVPLFLTSPTGGSSQFLISSTPAASSASSSFTSPFKTIKTYAGKVRKSRLDSR